MSLRTDQAVTVRWAWEPALRERLHASVLPPADAQRVRAYLMLLADGEAALAVGAAGAAPSPRQLVDLLPRVFGLAQQRTLEAVSARMASVGDGRAPERTALQSLAMEVAAQENRAALLALALYATQEEPGRWVPPPPGRTWPTPRPVQLGGRDDFAQHWLVSAVLASGAGGRLADAMGSVKEMADTQGGSGFSFNDLAADRAGTRIGQRAAHEPLALQTQFRQALPLMESDVMPEVADLPQFLSSAEFQQRYGNVQSSAYKALLADIEARVDRCRLARSSAAPG